MDRRVYTRRELLGRFAVSAAVPFFVPRFLRAADPYESKRPEPSARRFRSKAVDAAIASVSAKIGDPELAWLFSNCLPNTLDTTVTYNNNAQQPDTVVM